MRLEWKDPEGTLFQIRATRIWNDSDPIIANLNVCRLAEFSDIDVFVRDSDALALIDWLQNLRAMRQLEQSSTAQSSGAIMDVDLTDTEQRH